MPSVTFNTNDVLTAAHMNRFGQDPQQTDVATDDTRSAASYAALTTAGPSVTISLTNGQKVLVYVKSEFLTAADGSHGYHSFSASGGLTLSANDTNAAHFFAVKVGSNTTGVVSAWTLVTATSTASTTFTSLYRGDGTNTMHFLNRRMIVLTKF
jgi:hypothetical protein